MLRSVESLQREIAQRRKNLDRLEEQKAMHGLDVPLAILNAIDREKAEIARIEAILVDPALLAVEQVDPVWQTRRDFVHRATRAYAASLKAKRSRPGSP